MSFYLELLAFIMRTEESNEHNFSDITIFDEGFAVDKYVVQAHIGHGGYGEVYSVKDTLTGEKYAMKVENIKSEKASIFTEVTFLQNVTDSYHFPKFIGQGTFGDFNYLVIEILGSSLSKTRRELSGRRYSTYTALRISCETLICIQKMHHKGYIHRDIKPGNFLIRPNKEYPICLIDFGLSTTYIDSTNRNHFSISEDSGFVGTCKYASINAHQSLTLSRRDDLISWIYSIIECFEGRLPWPASRDKAKTYQKKKDSSKFDLLSRLPAVFSPIYDHVFSLKFEERPNYEWIQQLLKSEIDSMNPNDHILDWYLLNNEKVKSISAIPLTPPGELNQTYSNDYDTESDSTTNNQIEAEGGCVCRL